MKYLKKFRQINENNYPSEVIEILDMFANFAEDNDIYKYELGEDWSSGSVYTYYQSYTFVYFNIEIHRDIKQEVIDQINKNLKELESRLTSMGFECIIKDKSKDYRDKMIDLDIPVEKWYDYSQDGKEYNKRIKLVVQF